MRNRFKTRKATARPIRYAGHDDDPAQPACSPSPTPPDEKALVESAEGRLSVSMCSDRPSVASDYLDGHFEASSFELPRR